LRWFHAHSFPVDDPPDWFKNPFSDTRASGPLRHWSDISDFDPSVGDIKTIWEPSRFDWVAQLAESCGQTRNPVHLRQINAWTADWLRSNPPNAGPNWKCGQEASIRLMNVLLAARRLGQDLEPSRALIDFVHLHLRRIWPTVGYAIGQNNNHGMSEAAALFIGASWLERVRPDRWASRIAREGRRLLEDRVAALFETDGSFAQYSVTYHRMALDVLNQAELHRRHLGLAPFSRRLCERGLAASIWLQTLTDPISGDAPNLGANDGTQLFASAPVGYRDFRPSWQQGLNLWRDGQPHPPRRPTLFPSGGYAILDGTRGWTGRSWALLRFPKFRFRPSHADALHVDLWADGRNILRDAGTYSYNDGDDWLRYFSGTAAHNTVQFDDTDQMPRLGRFLFGSWLTTEALEYAPDVCTASYRDPRGRRHKRSVRPTNFGWTVEDNIEGFERKAVLRWRLPPGHWQLQDYRCTGPLATLSVEMIEGNAKPPQLETGFESRHYFERTPVPVFTLTIDPPKARIVTHVLLVRQDSRAGSDVSTSPSPQ
jgi:hypothetical protein